ncbi:hypothetical protein OIE66_27690 [Nonomuraea sp. NBC_01738]|uniref:hypothetical protein n=1 Tax=Nonomuraea sp. NBC_01738 TaxID=2976003 RepID=UPI002E147B27|nr:hypothetical protein OIE66_27690 [Nonomuraea sp. NBC_01738]
MKFRIVAVVWGALVTAVLVVLPLSLRARLPETLAVHWNDGPDRSSGFTGFMLGTAGLWVAIWLVMLAMAVFGKVLERRLGRAYWWGFVIGLAVFAVGMQATTLYANLDKVSWTEAVLPGWAVVAVLAGATAAGVGAGFLGRGEPDQPVPEGERPPALKLRPGQRSVWVSRVGNPWLLTITMLSAVALLVSAALSFVGALPGGATAVPFAAFAVVFLVGLLSGSATVRASEDGVAVGFGPFGWPVRRIRLSKIESAWSEQRFPSQVGGWGIRGVPGAAAIMLRGGDCLVLRYRSGGQLLISVDDAARGASLINALIEERNLA